MAKIKNKVKKAFRLPNNAVVMSMMAVILVCAAPALVSVIDDTYTYEGSSEIQLLDVEDSKGRILMANNQLLDSSYIAASENDGTFLIALNDSTLVEDVNRASFTGIDMAPIISGAGSVKVVTSSDVTGVRVGLKDSSENITYLDLIRSESDLSVWTGSFSSVELVKLKSGEYDEMFVNLNGSNELFDMQIFAVGEYVIPYGEIIIGATGAILIVCALFATPWFSTSGLTIKRRR